MGAERRKVKMGNALWEAQRELTEREARSLTSQEVAMRKDNRLRECLARHIMYSRWIKQGAQLRHISEIPANNKDYYEFFWSFSQEGK
jgi:hypothetical protein